MGLAKLTYEYAMIDLKKMIPGNPRTRLAGLLIAISLISAMAISSAANQASWVWAANSDLSSGHTVAATDLKKVKANLFDSGARYFTSETKLVGWHLIRQIRSGELIPLSAVAQSSAAIASQSLPLRIARSDMPIDLASGQKVDLYALAANNVQSTSDPILAFTGATVESIDQKSKDLGGDIGIVVAIPKVQMLQVVTDLANSKVLVVRDAF